MFLLIVPHFYLPTPPTLKKHLQSLKLKKVKNFILLQKALWGTLCVYFYISSLKTTPTTPKNLKREYIFFALNIG